MIFRVNHSYDGITRLCADWEYVPAGDRDTVPRTDITDIDITPDDIAFEREKDADGHRDAYLETLAMLRLAAEKAAFENVILFHSSSMLYGGRAYLFTAPSGTGKTTHCRLWKELLGDNTAFLNGDKPFIRLTADGPVIFGTPWKGKEGYGGNISAPIGGICLVGRGTENRVTRADFSEVLPRLIRQTYRPRTAEAYERVMKSLIATASSVPVFEMSCNISAEAAAASFEAMTGEKAPQTFRSAKNG
ncbi:MAG: hypothetical protein MJ137_04615 [Clostridia bacterium]|nr:hypothetical protein [Clostridia bacterium]